MCSQSDLQQGTLRVRDNLSAKDTKGTTKDSAKGTTSLLRTMLKGQPLC